MKSIVVIFFILANLSFAQTKEQLFHDDNKRTWLTYLPSDYSEDISYPLIIALHGGGGNARQLMNNTRKRFNQLADEENFIVVYPQGVKKSWNDNHERDQNGYARKKNIDDVGFIEKMITKLEANYSINSEAIFACGISNGGLMSQTLAMELPEKIKAIGLVASNFGKNQIEKLDTNQPFSIIVIHGEDDPVFPYNEGEIGVFNKPRGKVLGVNKTIDYMLNLNGNSTEPLISEIENTTNDNCNSEHLKYPNFENSMLKVELINVSGGGHTWPGAKEQRLITRIVGVTTQDFSACDKLWVFFKSFLN
jgi:polyhydroxybutyrate depolymerase